MQYSSDSSYFVGSVMPTFTKELEESLHRTLGIANDFAHEMATLEHLLLGLMKDDDALKMLIACGVNCEVLFAKLKAFIIDDLTELTSPSPNLEAAPTTGFQRVIQRSAIRVQASDLNEVNSADVILAMLAEREANACRFLSDGGATRAGFVDYIDNDSSKIFGTPIDQEKLDAALHEIKKVLPEMPTLSGFDRQKRINDALLRELAKENQPDEMREQERKSISSNIYRDSKTVAIQARSIQLLIREELDRMKLAKPNFQTDNEAAIFHHREEFFERILNMLDDLISDIINLEREDNDSVSNVVTKIQSMKEIISDFAKTNHEATFWGAQMPAMLGFVALFSAAGANMVTATPLIMALCGGDRIVKLLKSMKD